MQPTKPLFQSKTFWANILALVAIVIGNITDPNSAFHFSAFWDTILTSALTIINIFLRSVTTTAIKGVVSKQN